MNEGVGPQPAFLSYITHHSAAGTPSPITLLSNFSKLFFILLRISNVKTWLGGPMKHFLLMTIAAVALNLFPLTTGSAQGPDSPPTYSVKQSESPIRIDGNISPGEWKDATRVELNYEIDPGNNLPAKVKTEAFVTYDRKNLYVAFIAHDPNPKKIHANISDRDAIWQNDIVGIAIDPFNDRRRGYEFFVNPYGVQGDIKRVEGSGEDSTWDTIWNSAGRITENGYEVEFAIPFNSISFPNGTGIHTWGFWFFRAYPRDFRYQISNVPFDRDKNCFFCQIGYAKGFEGVHPGRNLEVNPTLTTTAAKSRDEFGDPMIDHGSNTQLGMNVRWAPSSNVILNAALNPDFSQVEADTAQLSYNRQFSLFYDEKRPVFLEGADIFQTEAPFVYTRTISDPSYVLKASGKSGKYAWGVFNAHDTITNLILPGSRESSFTSWDSDSDVTVGRIRRDVLKNSTIGALVTHREGAGYHNTLFSLDGRINFTDSDAFKFQVATADTRNPDDPENEDLNGESMSGNAYDFRFEHEDEHWGFDAWHMRIGDEFRSDVGFMPQVGFVESGLGISHHRYGKDKAFISRYSSSFSTEIQKDMSGNAIHRVFHFEQNLNMAGQSYLGYFYDIGMRSHENINHHYANYGFWTGGKQQKFTYSLDMFFGENVDFTNNRIGNWTMTRAELTFLPTPHINFKLDATEETMKELGGKLFTAHILQTHFVYNFNTRMLIRTIIQYTTLEKNPKLYADLDNRISRSLFPQILFSHKINPRTLLYLGYSGSRAATELNPMQSFERTLFFKVAYAWRL